MPDSTTCSVDECTNPVLARTWCTKHYLRWYKYGDTGTPPRFVKKQCSVGGCERTAEKRTWCATHYRRWARKGTTDDPPPKPEFCAFEGCGLPPRARGWCKRHHKYMTRQGTEHEMRRYALKVGSQAGPVDYAAILAEHGMVCHICGCGIRSRRELNFDHVIPLTRGGPHVQENILPSHKSCNVSKGNRLMSELAGRG
jgi:HNH endonuclease